MDPSFKATPVGMLKYSKMIFNLFDDDVWFDELVSNKCYYESTHLMCGPMKYPSISPCFGISLTEESITLEPISPLRNGSEPTRGSLGSPVLNFINFLHSHFSYKSVLHNFSLITVRLCDFFAKGNRQKSLCKMLMKLTPGGKR